MSELDPTKVVFHKHSLGDSFGKVFTFNGKLFRGIYPESETEAKELFSSGLIEKLYKEKLIPHTKLSDYTLNGFAFVIEHDYLPHVTYPHEWSFSMLKDAALAALRVNTIALELGYETKDCHAYNVIFRDNQPVFVDIGSFVKVSDANVNLLCYEEMLMDYYFPLKIWQKDYYTAKRIIADENGLFPHKSYYWIKYGYPFNRVRYYTDKARKGLFILYNKESFFKPNALKRKKKQVAKLTRMTSGLKPSGRKSTWHNYHTRYLDKNGNLISTTPRFDKIVELMSKYEIQTVTELAGNQGVMSKMLLQKIPSIKKNNLYRLRRSFD